MGDCKSNMKSSKDKDVDLTTKTKGIFGRLKKKKIPTPEHAKTFVDMIEAADDSLQALIATKEDDLRNESGREVYNQRALALLKTMAFHLDSLIASAAEYDDQ